MPEGVDAAAVMDALWRTETERMAAAGAHAAAFNARNWGLYVSVGRTGINRKWVEAYDAPLFRRALNTACKLGLDWDAEFADWVLRCRFVWEPMDGGRSGTVADSEAAMTARQSDGTASPALSGGGRSTLTSHASPEAGGDAGDAEGGQENNEPEGPDRTEGDDGDASPTGPTTEPIEISSDSDSDDGDESESSRASDAPPDPNHDAVPPAHEDPDADEVADNPSLDNITLGGTQEEWDEACAFLAYQPPPGEKGEGKRLFGTTQTLRPGQMHGVWHFLNATYGQGRTGYINALDTGLGKTMVSLGIVAVLRAVELMGLLCKRDPEHGCRLAEEFGYRDCVCEEGSLMSAIHDGLAQGITVFLAPNTTLAGAYKTAENFLMGEVELRSEGRRRFVEVLAQDDAKRIPFGTPGDVVVQSIKARKGSGKRAGSTAKKETKASSNPFNNDDVRPCEGGPTMQDLPVSYSVTQRARWFQDRHLLVVLPCDPSSLNPKNALVSGLTDHFAFREKNRKSPRRISIVWPIWCRTLIMDEFHRVKGENTLVYTTVEKLARRHPEGNGRGMVALFLSATPFTNDLKGSLAAPLKFVMPDSWDASDESGGRRAMSRARFYELLSAVSSPRRPRRPGASESGDNKASDARHKAAFTDLKDFLAGFMTRRTAVSCFLGDMECALPPHHCETVDCQWEAQGASERLQWAAMVGESTSDGRKGASNVFNKLTKNEKFVSYLLGATFVHPSRFDEARVGRNALAAVREGWDGWIQATHANNIKYLTAKGRRDHEAATSGAIDHLCDGSPKVAKIEDILGRAMADRSGPADGFDYPKDAAWAGIKGPVKKHVVLFCSRPSVAVLLAVHADRRWSDRWNIHLLTAGNTWGRQEAIDAALAPVDIDDARAKPSILIAVTTICGEGVNGMQNACYSVLVDLPFSEATKTQTRGRVFRYGQVHTSHHYELVSAHPAERAILARHEKRDDEFNRILADSGAYVGDSTSGTQG